MTTSNLLTAAIWSYGLAAAGFLAFALRMAIGWHGGLRAALLLSAIVASALWAASEVTLAIWPSAATWISSNVLDTVRYALWFGFLYGLVSTTRQSAVDARAKLVRAPWGLIFAVGVGFLASVALRDQEPLRTLFGVRAGVVLYGVRVGLAVVGLVLVERLLRSAAPHARWAIKPLCLGLTGIFGFDLFCYSDAMLFGRQDLDIWVARGIAHALVLPFVAVAAARNPAWTIEMHLSRGAVLRSSALLVSGLFLLAVAAAGYFVRYVGGELGKALQIEFLFAALLLFALAAFSGSFRSKLKVFVSKHFFSYRYDYREEWLRFTRSLSADNSPQSIQQRSIRALADLVESPAGGALEHVCRECRGTSGWFAGQVSGAHGLGGRSRRACLGTRALPRARASRMARLDAGSVAGGSAPLAGRPRGVRRARHGPCLDQGRLGSPRSAEDRWPAGGKLSRSDSDD